MPHNLDLIFTLTGGLLAALIFGFITQRLKLSPIVGYLLAGVAVGPFTPGFVAHGALAEQLAVGRPVAPRRDDEPRRDLDPPADLDGAARLVALGADQDVRQHVVAGDDPRERLADDARLLEDVPQQLFVLPAAVHTVAV